MKTQMINNTKYFAVIFASITSMCGCATVDTFQKMNSYERAQYVCSRDSYYERLRNDESSQEARIDDISSALTRGYRVHKSCKTVKVEKPGTVSCTSNGVGTRINTDWIQLMKIFVLKHRYLSMQIWKKGILRYPEIWWKEPRSKKIKYTVFAIHWLNRCPLSKPLAITKTDERILAWQPGWADEIKPQPSWNDSKWPQIYLLSNTSAIKWA